MKIYLDIETKPCTRADIAERVQAAIKPPANYKSAEAIAKWWVSEGEAQRVEAVSKTALNGLWGQICCIGWAVDDGAVHVSAALDEASTLTAWMSQLQGVIRDQMFASADKLWDSRATWVGHNLQDFDLRFLWQRCVIRAVPLPFMLPMERYPRGPWVYDTMKEWCGYGKYVKQTDLELALGLVRHDPLPNGGADVEHAQLSDIHAHCAEDVRLLREIYKRMWFLS